MSSPPKGEEFIVTDQRPSTIPRQKPPHIAGRSRLGWICFWIYWGIFALLAVGEISEFFSAAPATREATGAFLLRLTQLFLIFFVPYWVWMWLIYYSPPPVRKISKFAAAIFAIFGLSE